MDQIGDITVFGAIVERGSFAEAARQLGMTPSGVSRRISRFEERLGTRLFHRTTRKLNLTEAGEALAERCDAILHAIEDAEETATRLGGTPSGTLRIAASDAFAIIVLVPFLKGFRDEYPDLNVVIEQGDGSIDMFQRRADLAIRPDVPSGASLITRKLIDDPWVVCASPDYLARHGRPAEPRDLLDHNCLTIRANDRVRDVWPFLDPGKNGIEALTIHGAVSGIGLIMREAALAGVGIGRLAHLIVGEDIRAGKLIPVLSDFMPENERSLYAVYPSRTHLSVKVRVFLDALVSYIRTNF